MADAENLRWTLGNYAAKRNKMNSPALEYMVTRFFIFEE